MKSVALAVPLAAACFVTTQASAQSWLCEGPNCQDGLFRQIESNFNEAWKRSEATLGAAQVKYRISPPHVRPRPGEPEPIERCHYRPITVGEFYEGPVELLIGANQAVVKFQGHMTFDFLQGAASLAWFEPARSFAQTYSVSFRPGPIDATTQVAGFGNLIDETFNGAFLQSNDHSLSIVQELLGDCQWTPSFRVKHTDLRTALQERARVVFDTAVKMSLGM